MDTVPITPSELGRIAGPLMIGYILNWGLFGVLSMQVYVYYLAFPRDRFAYKALVYGTYMLESAQTFLFTNTAFSTFATGFGNPKVLDQVDILWFSVPIMGGLVAFMVQAFYAYRITVLSQRKYSALFIMLLAFVQLGGAIAVGVQTKKAVVFSHFLRTDSLIAAGIWEGGSTVCDVMIAVCMTYYLRRRDSGHKKTRVLLTRIIRLTIETGIFTAVVAILTLILTFLPGRSTYYQAAMSVLGKVYSNSMMVAFNTRVKIGPSNATSSAHQPTIPLSRSSRSRSDMMDGDISRSTMHGILVTREEVSFPPSKNASVEQDLKKNTEDIYTEDLFSRSTK